MRESPKCGPKKGLEEEINFYPWAINFLSRKDLNPILTNSLFFPRELHKLTIVDDKKQGNDRKENEADDNNPDILKGSLIKITSDLKTKRCEDKTTPLEDC